VTRDPLGNLWPLGAGEPFSATVRNVYAYGLNSPMAMVDPSGLDPIALPFSFFGFGGATAAGGLEAGEAGLEAGASAFEGATGWVLISGAMAWGALPSQVTALANEWDTDAFFGQGLYAPPADFAQEHTKGARPSTAEDHEYGEARKKRDQGREKADKAGRRPHRRRPFGWKGPWPPGGGSGCD
jgi:hypothetical protein